MDYFCLMSSIITKLLPSLNYVNNFYSKAGKECNENWGRTPNFIVHLSYIKSMWSVEEKTFGQEIGINNDDYNDVLI